MLYTNEQVERLLVDAGHAINLVNGRCGRVEDVLCKTTTLGCQFLQLLEVQEAAGRIAADLAMTEAMAAQMGVLGLIAGGDTVLLPRALVEELLAAHRKAKGEG